MKPITLPTYYFTREVLKKLPIGEKGAELECSNLPGEEALVTSKGILLITNSLGKIHSPEKNIILSCKGGGLDFEINFSEGVFNWMKTIETFTIAKSEPQFENWGKV